MFRTEQDKLQDFAKQKGINIAKSDNQFVRQAKNYYFDNILLLLLVNK